MKYNDISLNLKKLFRGVLPVFLCFSVIFFAACSGGEDAGDEGQTGVGGSGFTVCSAADFALVKEDWYGVPGVSLLSERAGQVCTSNVVVGEEYYLVYTENWAESRGAARDQVSCSFRLRGESGVSETEESVSVGEIMFDEKGNVEWTAEGKLSAQYTFENVPPHTYLIFPFIPLGAGQLVIETSAQDPVYLNAVSAEHAEDGAFAEVSDLSVAWLDPSSSSPVSDICVGKRYYLDIEFSLQAFGKDSAGKTVICSVFCSGDFTDGIRIQEAATADYEWTEYAGKDVLQLRFEVPPQAEQKQTRRVTLDLQFASAGSMNEFAVTFYSGDGQLLGNLAETFSVSVYKDQGESEQSATDGTLVYRFERETQSYIVTGIQEGVIREVTIPETFRDYPVTEIAPNAFSDSYIQSITIGSMVRTIGAGAFSRCDDLEQVTFGVNVQTIGASAFEECGSLEQVTLPLMLRSVGENAFASSPLQSVHIPENVEEIGAGAFACGSLTRDRNYSDFNLYNFRYTLQEFTVSSGNEHYASVDGVLFTKDMDTLVSFPMGDGRERKTYTVPEGVREIAAGAFLNTEKTTSNYDPMMLKKISLPASLECIGANAFFVDVYSEYVENQGSEGFTGYIKHSVQYEGVTFSDGGDWQCGNILLPQSGLADAASAAALLSENAGSAWVRV